MPAEGSDFSSTQLMLSHVFQCSSKEQFPIEAPLDFLIIKINTVSSKLMIMRRIIPFCMAEGHLVCFFKVNIKIIQK